ncbi:hypothetical protein GCM10027053_20910 [Intrasporangium mesophilum]
MALAAVLLFWFGAGSASAHSVLLRSDPPSGAVLASSPPVVTLEFDEEITTRLSTARLVDASGREVSGVAVQEASNADDLRVSVPPTGRGTFSLLWRVMSADDGHVTDGVVVFTVGTPSGTVATQASTGGGSIAESVVPRWLLLAGLAMALGAAVMGPVLRGRGRAVGQATGPDGIPRRATARLSALILLGAGVALGASCADLLLRARAVAGPEGVPDAMRTLTADTTWGRLWLCRALTLGAVIVIVATRRGRRSAERPSHSWLVTSLVAVAVATEATSGHAAALPSGVPEAQVVAVVHALTALTWVGGVVALLVLLLPGGGAAAAISQGRWRIATLFVGSTTLLAASGLVSAGLEVPVSDGLAGTGYGRALVVKLLVAVPLLAIAAANANRLHGFGWGTDRAGSPGPRRAGLLAEVCLGGAVLVVAAVLLDQVPARSVAPPPAPAQEQFASRTLDDLVLSVSSTPGWIGSNGVTVRVASTRRPAPAPIESVSLDVRRAGSTEHVPMSPTEPGSWYAVVDLDGSPGLQLSPVVTREGHRLTATFPWAVTVARPTPPSGISLASWADGLAVLVLVGGTCGMVLLRRAGRRPTPSRTAGPTIDVTIDGADAEPSRLA